MPELASSTRVTREPVRIEPAGSSSASARTKVVLPPTTWKLRSPNPSGESRKTRISAMPSSAAILSHSTAISDSSVTRIHSPTLWGSPASSMWSRKLVAMSPRNRAGGGVPEPRAADSRWLTSHAVAVQRSSASRSARENSPERYSSRSPSPR